jgi:hypothetical protein
MAAGMTDLASEGGRVQRDRVVHVFVAGGLAGDDFLAGRYVPAWRRDCRGVEQ